MSQLSRQMSARSHGAVGDEDEDGEEEVKGAKGVGRWRCWRRGEGGALGLIAAEGRASGVLVLLGLGGGVRLVSVFATSREGGMSTAVAVLSMFSLFRVEVCIDIERELTLESGKRRQTRGQCDMIIRACLSYCKFPYTEHASYSKPVPARAEHSCSPDPS